jgi:hypothetical protein
MPSRPDHETTLALGVRVAIHDARQNDRNPVIWQPGQQYPAADAIHAAHTQPTRTRRGLWELQNSILRLSRLAGRVATILKEDRVVILARMRHL